jgi:hypothetical protein
VTGEKQTSCLSNHQNARRQNITNCISQRDKEDGCVASIKTLTSPLRHYKAINWLMANFSKRIRAR